MYVCTPYILREYVCMYICIYVCEMLTDRQDERNLLLLVMIMISFYGEISSHLGRLK